MRSCIPIIKSQVNILNHMDLNILTMIKIKSQVGITTHQGRIEFLTLPTDHCLYSQMINV